MTATLGTNGRGRSQGAIVGLGLTDVGKVYGKTAADFAQEAVLLACADAGITKNQLDGLLMSSGLTGGVNLSLARDLGLRDLRVLSEITAYGATAGAMVAYASLAIAAGMATTIACVWADAPLVEAQPTGAMYARQGALKGLEGLAIGAGISGPNQRYALAARRHMAAYGTTIDHLGAVAVQTRAWATRSPIAQMRTPITLDDHHNSRIIADPLRLLDCCLVSNGGAAVIITAPERASSFPQPEVHVLGFGQCHPGYVSERGSDFGLVSGAASSGRTAMTMAQISPADVDVCELYDCYTYTTLISLEDYGFCAKGEGGPFVASGAIGPGGSLPTNTGGGQLSGYYLWGMTPLTEAVIQTRGQGGARQVDDHDVVLVSGNGGVLDHHATMILSPHDHS